MGTPPKGVDDVFAATMVLLAGTSPSVVTTKAGKVKDRSWDAAKKQLLGKPKTKKMMFPRSVITEIYRSIRTCIERYPRP